MKGIARFAVAALAALLAAAAICSAAAKPGKWEKVVFATHIHCESCVAKLEANLSYEKGVKGLEISLEDQTVTFEYDPKKTSKEKLAEAMKKIGYEGQEVTSCDGQTCCSEKTQEAEGAE